MKVLKKIDYIDVVYFRKASLVLDAEGTTFVTGLNRNSSKGRKSNGAGKTLLVSGVSHLRHGSPVGTAQSLHRNSLLSSPNSRMEWEIENPEGNWRFAKYRQGKAIKWDVSLNGEPLLFKTATQAEQAAAKVFDFNDEEFYSTVYLDSRRPNPVLHGTGTARQAFLSGLFRLEGYAAIKSWFVERLKDARAKEAAMRELEDAVRDVSGDAKDVDKAKTRLAKLDGQVDELEKKAVGLRDDLETRRSFDLFRKLGKSAAKYDKDVLKKAEDVLHAWRQYEANEDFRKEQMERLAVYEKDAAALKRTLKEAREKNTTALAAAVGCGQNAARAYGEPSQGKRQRDLPLLRPQAVQQDGTGQAGSRAEDVEGQAAVAGQGEDRGREIGPRQAEGSEKDETTGDVEETSRKNRQ